MLLFPWFVPRLLLIYKLGIFSLTYPSALARNTKLTVLSRDYFYGLRSQSRHHGGTVPTEHVDADRREAAARDEPHQP